MSTSFSIFVGPALLTFAIVGIAAVFVVLFYSKSEKLRSVSKKLFSVQGTALTVISLSVIAGIAWSVFGQLGEQDVNQLLNVRACGSHKIQLTVK